jgi:hypothetical protein
MNLTHKCPVAGCDVDVDRSKLMCNRHWRRVSRNTANELYAAYKEQPRSPRHANAMRAAINEAEGAGKRQGQLL